MGKMYLATRSLVLKAMKSGKVRTTKPIMHTDDVTLIRAVGGLTLLNGDEAQSVGMLY